MIRIAYGHLLARRPLLMVCVLAVSCCALQAQPDGLGGPPPGGPPPGEMQQQQSRGPSVDRELKQLTRLLTLTTEQQAQVKTILTDQRQQIEALFNESKPAAKNGKTHQEATTDDDRQVNMEAMEKVRDAAKTIREDADTKIAATLTDDQKTKFAAWKQKQAKAFDRQERDGMPPPPPDGGDGPPPDGGGGGGAPGGGGPPGV